ncbi:hypothetical protein COV16_06445 [Candidatus Woesearchaeota archaeon CG10_big_fil_rev_8_21_14_0_10_34_8]|nr:MAG: hypothetical protein COV16_06445 [Candidatus Woesearchaeota archaeon CG10_big_fil_rev_8_21_14_0_10_34_8]
MLDHLVCDHVNNLNWGEEVISKYGTRELREIIAQYNNDDALIVIDIDDCIRDSPAKKMAFKEGLKKPKLWGRYLEWGLYGALEGLAEAIREGSIKAAETKVFSAYRSIVLSGLTGDERRDLATKSITPLYSDAANFVGNFRNAHKVIVSRNIAEVVDATVQELGCDAGYHEQDDKVAKVSEAAKEKRRILIIGDSKEDAEPIAELLRAGKEVDFVYVMKDLNPDKVHPEATMAIPRNFTGIHELVTGRYDQTKYPSAVEGMKTLVKEGIKNFVRYFNGRDLVRLVRDTLDRPRRHEWKRDYKYLDLQDHFDGRRFGEEGYSAKDIIRCYACPKVDILAICNRESGDRNSHEASFDAFLAQMDKEEIEYERLDDNLVKVPRTGWKRGDFYLIKGQEVQTVENQEVMVIGDTENYEQRWHIEELLEHLERKGVFHYLTHPNTIYTPTWSFRYPSAVEKLARDQWAREHNTPTELNHMSCLWMGPANWVTEQYHRDNRLGIIQNTDTHYDPAWIGRARTGIRTDLLDLSSGEALSGSLREAVTYENNEKGNIVLDRAYSSGIRFFRNMMWPVIKRVIRH